MGKVNMKLMQGIEAIEDQVKNDKEIQEGNVSGGAINAELSKKSSDKTEQASDVLPESQMEASKEQEQAKKKRVVADDSKMKRNTNKTPQKHVFSFRALVSDISFWKTYAMASGRTMEDIGSDAMNSYIKKHKLTETEQAVFNALIARSVDMQA